MTHRFPFSPYPNGWYAVAYTDELDRGSAKPIRYLGRDFVLFRTEGGRAHVLDAFCPHLGTHLGHGGTVKGELIQCPFHAWQFNGNGACEHIPYWDRTPEKARIQSYPVVERNGVILMHLSQDDTKPEYEIPEVPGLSAADWTEPRRWDTTIKTHVQEISENLVDIHHFDYLHGLRGAQSREITFDGPTLLSVLESEVGILSMKLFGLNNELSELRAPGGGDEFAVAKFATPIDENTTELRILTAVNVHDSREEADRRADVFRDLSSHALMQDVPIWENKRYQDRPFLVGDEAVVARFRRWAKQFYATRDRAEPPATS